MADSVYDSILKQIGISEADLREPTSPAAGAIPRKPFNYDNLQDDQYDEIVSKISPEFMEQRTFGDVMQGAKRYEDSMMELRRTQGRTPGGPQELFHISNGERQFVPEIADLQRKAEELRLASRDYALSRAIGTTDAMYAIDEGIPDSFGSKPEQEVVKYAYKQGKQLYELHKITHDAIDNIYEDVIGGFDKSRPFWMAKKYAEAHPEMDEATVRNVYERLYKIGNVAKQYDETNWTYGDIFGNKDKDIINKLDPKDEAMFLYFQDRLKDKNREEMSKKGLAAKAYWTLNESSAGWLRTIPEGVSILANAIPNAIVEKFGDEIEKKELTDEQRKLSLYNKASAMRTMGKMPETDGFIEAVVLGGLEQVPNIVYSVALGEVGGKALSVLGSGSKGASAAQKTARMLGWAQMSFPERFNKHREDGLGTLSSLSLAAVQSTGEAAMEELQFKGMGRLPKAIMAKNFAKAARGSRLMNALVAAGGEFSEEWAKQIGEELLQDLYVQSINMTVAELSSTVPDWKKEDFEQAALDFENTFVKSATSTLGMLLPGAGVSTSIRALSEVASTPSMKTALMSEKGAAWFAKNYPQEAEAIAVAEEPSRKLFQSVFGAQGRWNKQERQAFQNAMIADQQLKTLHAEAINAMEDADRAGRGLPVAEEQTRKDALQMEMEREQDMARQAESDMQAEEQILDEREAEYESEMEDARMAETQQQVEQPTAEQAPQEQVSEETPINEEQMLEDEALLRDIRNENKTLEDIPEEDMPRLRRLMDADQEQAMANNQLVEQYLTPEERKAVDKAKGLPQNKVNQMASEESPHRDAFLRIQDAKISVKQIQDKWGKNVRYSDEYKFLQRKKLLSKDGLGPDKLAEIIADYDNASGALARQMLSDGKPGHEIIAEIVKLHGYEYEKARERIAREAKTEAKLSALEDYRQSQKEQATEKPKKQKVPGGQAMAAVSEEDAFKQEQADEEVEKEVSEPVKKKAIEMKKPAIIDGALEILQPSARGEVAKKASMIVRKRSAEADQKNEMIRYRLNEMSKKFRFITRDEAVDFFDRMENGKKQPNSELQETADTLRELLDKGKDALQELGKLRQFYENYVPHMFKKPDKAATVIKEILSGRQFKPASFLKKRTLVTIKDGIDAGLELAHYNPVEMVILRLHEVNKYVAASKMMQDFKEAGLARFVPEDLNTSYLPAGYKFIDDPAFKVVSDNVTTVKEAYDKLLVDQLTGILTNLGIKHERLAKLKSNKAWGQSYEGARKIQTRFGGPVSIMAHELGHQIGNIYGLYDYITNNGPQVRGKIIEKGKYAGKESKSDAQKKRGVVAKEYRALADLRIEGLEESGENVSDAFKSYIRNKAEKEAVIMEAWLAAPEKMAKVAPTITEGFKNFLDSHEALKPLLNLDRSVVLGTREQEIEGPGVLTLGRWAVPAEVATIINNHLSPGLRGSKNPLIRGAYSGIRYIGNAMNQASLGMSAFHALNVSSDAISSHIGLALQKLARGDLPGFIKQAKMAPTAFATDLMKGGEIIKAMRQDLNQITDPKLKAIVSTVISAGGRASMDPMYHNNAASAVTESIRDVMFESPGIKAGAAMKLPLQIMGTVIEYAAKPIMEIQVPRLKLGVFFHMAQDVYEQANKKGWNDDRIQSELSDAWDSVDNRMGQLAYDNLHWNRLLKDSLMLAVRSVGWNLGSIREFGGGIKDLATAPLRVGTDRDIFTLRMGYFVGSAVSYAIQGAVITYLFTGKWPWDDDDWKIKDYYFPKTGRKNRDGSEERLSMPHYSKDWVAYTTNPMKTVKHKLHPFWGAMADVLDNQDYYGTKIRNEDDPFIQQLKDSAMHFGKSFIPISVKNFDRLNEAAGEVTIKNALIAISGIGSAPGYITRTPAQKLALQHIQENMGLGRTRTKEQAEKSQKRNKLVDKVRAGEDLTDSDKEGLTLREINGIIRDGSMAYLQTSFKRLSFSQQMDVFNAANKKERIELLPLLIEKRKNTKTPSEEQLEYFNELKGTLTPEQRIEADNQIQEQRQKDAFSKAKTLARKTPLSKSGRDKFKQSIAYAKEWMKANDVSPEDVLSAYIQETRGMKNKKARMRNIVRLKNQLGL